MKKFDKFIAGTIFAFVILVVGVNIWTEKKLQGTDSFYKVELNRVKQELLMYEEKTGRAPEDIAVLKAFVGGDYKSIEAIALVYLTRELRCLTVNCHMRLTASLEEAMWEVSREVVWVSISAESCYILWMGRLLRQDIRTACTLR